MKRMFDVIFSTVGLLLAAPIITICAIAVVLETRGSPIFAQKRVGRNQRLFTCYKMRTMRRETANVATHEVSPSAVTKVGRFLRSTKLDELPQLWNVLRGDMSVVGPRPCLPSQHDLIFERNKRGLFELRPGITGLAQVQGIDMSDPIRLALVDEQYLREPRLANDLKLIVKTIFGRGRGDRIPR